MLAVKSYEVTRIGGNHWGPGKDRRVFGDKHWNEPLKWDAKAKADGVKRKVFCASMADIMDDEAPAGQRERLWDVINRTPNLIWQLLTKRNCSGSLMGMARQGSSRSGAEGSSGGQAPPIIWIFTCNGIGPGNVRPPLALESRFVSRQNHVLKFAPPSYELIGAYLKAIWEREKGPKGYPVEYFAKLAKGIGVRDALNRLDSELLAPRPLKEIKAELAEVPTDCAADEELRECYAFLIPSEQERAVHLEKRAKDGKASKAELAQLRTYRSWNKRYANDAEKRMPA